MTDLFDVASRIIAIAGEMARAGKLWPLPADGELRLSIMPGRHVIVHILQRNGGLGLSMMIDSAEALKARDPDMNIRRTLETMAIELQTAKRERRL